MRELKIFLVVVVFTALVYWGVEPYAHSVMKPHVAPANFDYAAEDTAYAKGIIAEKEIALEDAKKSNDAKRIESAQKDLDKAKENLAKVEELWADVAKIDFTKGNAAKGKEFFNNNCFACHGVKEDDIAANITDSSLGVIPPDLSSAGVIFDEKFLAALIMNPALALKVDHKFGDAFIMTAYNSEVSGDSEELVNANIADVIAYLKEVGLKFEAKENATIKQEAELKYSKIEDANEKSALVEKEIAFAKDKSTFIEACGRCHDIKYDNFFTPSNHNDLANYLGSVPPDLSMMIRSRGEQYLHDFINNTQKLLPGTAMPRVGLTEDAQVKVVSYLEKVGDSKKEERESTGIYIMIFFVILSIFAIGWKRSVWSKLH
ncbi:cytochrome c1 [Campylobacter coli]|uniref:Cytochrome c1 n=2 Tax=Campylobacter coli TaxID=195 RepID=A0A381CG08_CAMCO|nr:MULTISPECIES: c-type cytochrome [Campylobacter]EAK3887841.1 cytochrome c1 [Campylobacter hyointestinalis]EIA55506.1 ubiquinol--cytochrome c reductase, cytochrome c1 subunit [Campylobacter coli 2698]EIA56404.1 ubiquinol--cytochrome c reductase, cytochrome c1 subunit [Campylobacter coli 2692]EIA76672.1 ubiquinol--cytochrome c reductase, cytochrome c1 subunit [Campylobacter coli 132-6]AGV09716.1 ubiquinol cytochrome c oxidoreductase, cytochrome c1 subunit [Campylobacter coli CVM N29710]